MSETEVIANCYQLADVQTIGGASEGHHTHTLMNVI